MKEERLKVLHLLEEGKIDAKAAENLLYALAKTAEKENKQKFLNWDDQPGQLNDKMNHFADALEDINTKTREALKGIEPKVKEAAKSLIEKTACLADEVSKNLNESLRKMEEERNNQDQQPPHQN